MKKIKKYIGIISFIIVLLIVLLIITQLKKEKGNENNLDIDRIQNNIEITKTTDVNDFYTVDKCVQTYLAEIELKDSDIALSLLDEEYIKENQIDEDNIWDYITEYSNKESYRTKEIYEINGEFCNIYFVKGRIDQHDIFFKVGIDGNRRAFCIIPIIEKEYEEKKIDKLDKQIDKKIYNVVVYQQLKEDMIAKSYYDDFLKAMLYDPEEAYLMLDEEYREKRFKNKQGFQEFINKNQEFFHLTYQVEMIDSGTYEDYAEYYDFREKHEDLGVKSYLKQEYEDYIQFVCADIYENYYIFNVRSPGDYVVIYDNHTVNLPAFTEKYRTASKQVKMGMNIEKFFDAINTKDYTYAYNLLADSFKTNVYHTQESFEEEIKQKLYEHNNVEYNNYTEEGDVLTYKITARDRTNENNGKELTIIMQLQEGTDFVMSFSIE
jgi:hypothetical protein